MKTHCFRFDRHSFYKAHATMALACVLLIVWTTGWSQPSAPSNHVEPVVSKLAPQDEDAARQSISLDGTWQLSYGPQRSDGPLVPADLAMAGYTNVPATVPGNVELDLMKAGKLPDLSVGTNIYALRDLEGYQWWYQRTFPTPSRAAWARVELVFAGLDCIGTVFLNGKKVGEAHNMLISHRLDVTDFLRHDGDQNELAVRIDSAVIVGRQHQPSAIEGAFFGNWESLAIRKAPHMYGWDIMPRIVSAGLWRSVRLEIMEPTRWTDVYFATLKDSPSNRTANVLLDWNFASDQFEMDGWHVHVTLDDNGKSVTDFERPVVGTHDRLKFDIKDADLWWPRGYGPHPLYDLTLELKNGDGKIMDTWRRRVGLRTVQLIHSDINTPDRGEFVFVVNGEKVFVKGSNWVPLDGLHSRDKQHLPSTFAMVVDLNCNLLRCWGGNVYEDNDFFDLCDQNGVMVWQDFALACAIYPQTDAFAEEIRQEAEEVVKKLRNHPGLVLWAGNNEIDSAYSGGWFGPRLDPNEDRLSRQVLPEVIREWDPNRDYLPSSPYHSPAMVAAGDQEQLNVEDHLWGARKDYKSPFYTQSPARFVSETGYFGCPSRLSLEQMMDANFLWPWENNAEWLTHAVRPLLAGTNYNYRIPLMAEQTAVLFGTIPDNLDDFILASQISQAEADKFFIELTRSLKWKRTGIIWWNLRDGWPIISDAVVDYFARKKLAYYFIKNVQTDVCAMCGEAEAGRHPLVVVNDTLTDARGHVVVSNLDTGQVLLESDYHVIPNGRATVGSIPSASHPEMWRIDWTAGNQHFQNHYLAGPRPYKLSDFKRWLKLLNMPIRQL